MSQYFATSIGIMPTLNFKLAEALHKAYGINVKYEPFGADLWSVVAESTNLPSDAEIANWRAFSKQWNASQSYPENITDWGVSWDKLEEIVLPLKIDLKCATCAEKLFCGSITHPHTLDCRIVFPPIDPRLQSTGPFVVLQNILNGDRFWSTSTTPQNDVLCCGEVTYRILGYGDTSHQVQNYLYPGIHSTSTMIGLGKKP